ncbi:MAG: sel1 repeat family protein [Proteobacteria bacterium]|nr:sel1 repeat family protein [Pseudomonadota bacterium]
MVGGARTTRSPPTRRSWPALAALAAFLPALAWAQTRGDTPLSALLARAERQIAAGHGTDPPHDNALDTWFQALAASLPATPAHREELRAFAADLRSRSDTEAAAGRTSLSVTYSVFAGMAEGYLAHLDDGRPDKPQATAQATPAPAPPQEPADAGTPAQGAVDAAAPPEPAVAAAPEPGAPPPEQSPAPAPSGPTAASAAAPTSAAAPAAQPAGQPPTPQPALPVAAAPTPPPPAAAVPAAAAPLAPPVQAPPPPAAAAPQANAQAPTQTPTKAPAPTQARAVVAGGPGPVHPDADAAALYRSRGDSMLAVKDISAARRFYALAADEGSGPAASALALTYDPAGLRQLGVIGMKPDPALALLWYRRAAALGDDQAAARLERLAHEIPGQP